jgi:hypothetical protein
VRQFANPGLLLFLLFWTAITSAFDGLMLYDAVKRTLSHTYQPVACTIEHNEVTVETDDEGSSYRVNLRYAYSVAGKTFTGTRIHAGNRNQFGRARANRFSSMFPANQTATAYFNPRNPAEAILIRGLLGNELFMALFMTPFNIVMVGLWYAFVCGRREIKSPSTAGGVKIVRDGTGTRARLRTLSPLFAATLGLGTVAFIGSLMIGFIFGEYASTWIMLLVWLTGFVTAAICYCRQHDREDSGQHDLILHNDHRRITLPLNCGRKTPIAILREEVSSLFIEEDPPADKGENESAWYCPTVALRNGTKHRLVKWSDHDQAESFIIWLKAELRLTESSIASLKEPTL